MTADETRTRLLAAAAAVFARRGYDGSSINEITSEAGLSTGAVYAHYGSKAELFAAMLRAHCRDEVERLLGGDLGVADLLAARGAVLDRRSPAEGSLLVEAIVAAKRDPEVAAVLVSAFAERETFMTELVQRAQRAGDIDSSVSAEAAARFTLMVALGSLLAAAIELPPVDHDGWSDLINGLVDRFRGREA